MLPNLRNFNLWIILISDVFLVAAAYFGSYLIRFDGVVLSSQMHAFQSTLFWVVPVYIAFFGYFNLYRGMWRYTGMVDSLNLFKAVAAGSGAVMTAVLLLHRFEGFSRSVFIINALLVFVLTGGYRVCIRFILAQRIGAALFSDAEKSQRKNLLIVGAGSAGEKLIRELRENRGLNYHLVGLIDDNPSKHRQTLHGVPVLGSLEKLPQLVEAFGIEEIAIAIPSASMKQMRGIIDVCKKTSATYKTLPGIGDIIQGKVTFSELRPVRYEDLLQRAPIELDNDLICHYLTNKRVMVTGGAGSIGSELCRQIAAFSPQKLIIVERNESGLYELELDLKTAFPELDVISALAAVQNQERMTQIFTLYRPEVVFHAAAYKHVPMMEHHPMEAIFNNVLGSRVVLQHCHRFDVQRCVMVSTDKAVRPPNIMGATKRLAELLTQSYAAESHTRYIAVRFGNVLGSVGSVLPLFRKQIAAGGPVTVTDPEMTRFFMTIPEACSLILQSGAYGSGGEIFILKMGTPVRIDDMARDLITLSGCRVGEDIEIRYTGLRPGEKLHEELITHGEGIRKTSHEDIMVLAAMENGHRETLEAQVDALIALAREGNAEQIKAKLHEIVPEYLPWRKINTTSKEGGTQNTPAAIALPCADRGCEHSHGYPLHRVAAEDRLLLQLLSISTETQRAFPLEALPIPDWEKIIQSALKHNVASLLYLQLKRAALNDHIPLKISKRLRKIYLYFVQNAVRQQYWLGKVLSLLEEARVSALLLNGPHLGENIYCNIAARPILRMSIYLLKEDLPRFATIQHKIAEIVPQIGIEVNITDRIFYPKYGQEIDPYHIWQRGHTAVIADHTIRVPSPEDLLIHLCLKFVFLYQFRYAGLQTLCDLREILSQYKRDLNWEIVLRLSSELSITNIVGLTLTLAEDLLNASISTETIQMFGTKDNLSFVREFALNIIFDEKHPNTLLPLHFMEQWESRSIIKRMRAFKNLISASLFTSYDPVASNDFSTQKNKVLTNLRACGRKFPSLIATCARTTTMLLANDKTMLEQLRQQQQNTLMWEWILGKREFSEKIDISS